MSDKDMPEWARIASKSMGEMNEVWAARRDPKPTERIRRRKEKEAKEAFEKAMAENIKVFFKG